MMAARRCSDPNLFYVVLLSFFIQCLNYSLKSAGTDIKVAKGHETRREAPSREGPPQDGGPGVLPPGYFFNLRHNLVQSGAFL